MLFDELKEAYLPDRILPEVEQLSELKKVTPEIGTGKRIDVLNAYQDDEIKKFIELSKTLPDKEHKPWDGMNDLFIQMMIWR